MTPNLTFLHSGCLALSFVVLATLTALAQEPAAKSEPSKATFLITGLHCPPCTNTVARSLQGTKGVKSVKVDWGTQNAKIEFDERVVSAQKLSGLIASTPHMMGRGMSYGGWLALKVDGVQNEETARKAKEALSAVKGVSKVVVYPKPSVVAEKTLTPNRDAGPVLFLAVADSAAPHFTPHIVARNDSQGELPIADLVVAHHAFLI